MYLVAYWSCNQIIGATNLTLSAERKSLSSEQIISWVKETLGSEEVNKIEQGE